MFMGEWSGRESINPKQDRSLGASAAQIRAGQAGAE
jgi:hypothetical protein